MKILFVFLLSLTNANAFAISCDTKWVKNVKIKGSILTATDASDSIQVHVKSLHLDLKSSILKNVIFQLGSSGDTATEDPLTANEASKITHAEMSMSTNEEIPISHIVLKDKNKHEIARFVAGGSDWSRCVVK